MLQIIIALSVFFFIVVPVVNTLLDAGATHKRSTSEEKEATKQAYRIRQDRDEYTAKRKQMIFFIKYPYLIPGTIGFMVIMGALSSPYVNGLAWVIWTVAITIMASYLLRALLKSSLKKLDDKYRDLATEV